MKRILYIVIALCFSAFGFALDSITAMQITPHGADWRVQFNVTGPAAYQGFVLSNPTRVVLDVDAKWRVHSASKKPALIRAVRSGPHHTGTRIVLDMQTPVAATFMMRRSEEHTSELQSLAYLLFPLLP